MRPGAVYPQLHALLQPLSAVGVAHLAPRCEGGIMSFYNLVFCPYSATWMLHTHENVVKNVALWPLRTQRARCGPAGHGEGRVDAVHAKADRMGRGHVRALSQCRFVLLFLVLLYYTSGCTTAHPLHTIFTKIIGASVSEARMRPNPTRRLCTRATSRTAGVG